VDFNELRRFENGVFKELKLSNTKVLKWAEHGIGFSCSLREYERKFVAAKCVVLENIRYNPVIGGNILKCGGHYDGAWFEGITEEAEVFRLIDFTTAKRELTAFLSCQEDDGYIPYSIKGKVGRTHIGWGSIAREIWEIYLLERDKEWLAEQYPRLVSWTNWLFEYRDFNEDGILESWHYVDIGVDFDPRYAQDLPLESPTDVRDCPEPGNEPIIEVDVTGKVPYEKQKARVWHLSYAELVKAAIVSERMGRIQQGGFYMHVAALKAKLREKFEPINWGYLTPNSSPDVNAMVYCDLQHLAKIASELGDSRKSKAHKARAAALRKRVDNFLWDNSAGCYFDRDRHGNLIKINTITQLRMLNCGFATKSKAKKLFERHILNTDRFWTSFPFPSVSSDEETARPEAYSCWHGPTFCPTMTRAPRAFINYGRRAELLEAARRITGHLVKRGGFAQQYNPHTGKPGAIEAGISMSATALAYIEYVALLCGVIPRKREVIEWNCFGLPEINESIYRQELFGHIYVLKKKGTEFSGYINEKRIFKRKSGYMVVTDSSGKIKSEVLVEKREEMSRDKTPMQADC